MQIQQSADCAYGEVISARQNSGERLSLASSYRVFVDRLLAPFAPWQMDVQPPLAEASAQPQQPSAALVPERAPSQRPDVAPVPSHSDLRAPRTGAPLPTKGKKVYLSYAREDRSRVSLVASELTRRGFDVWFDRDIASGVDFQAAVAAALDASDVVMVFWSKASVASDFVRLEAGEGSRRGILVPVLLDESLPPLEFRYFQSADLSRSGESGLARLLDDVARVSERVHADPAEVAASRWQRSANPKRSLAALSITGGAAVIIMALAWLVVRQLDVGLGTQSIGNPIILPRPPAPTSTSAGSLEVPDFRGRSTEDVQKVAEVVGLSLMMTDESNSVEQRYLEGVVLSQLPAAGSRVGPNATIKVTVATRTTIVPSVAGIPLGTALGILQQSGLALGNSEVIVATSAPEGRVISQVPQAGTRVPAGTMVNVGVAAATIRQRN